MGKAWGLSVRGHVLVHLFFFSVIFNGASVYLKTFKVKLLSKIFA